MAWRKAKNIQKPWRSWLHTYARYVNHVAMSANPLDLWMLVSKTYNFINFLRPMQGPLLPAGWPLKRSRACAARRERAVSDQSQRRDQSPEMLQWHLGAILTSPWWFRSWSSTHTKRFADTSEAKPEVFQGKKHPTYLDQTFSNNSMLLSLPLARLPEAFQTARSPTSPLGMKLTGEMTWQTVKLLQVQQAFENMRTHM